VDYTRNPTKNAEQDIDEKICATPSSHCDRQERNPYRKKIEKDSSLYRIRYDVQGRFAGERTVLDGMLVFDTAREMLMIGVS
jgi:hypothetical protein